MCVCVWRGEGGGNCSLHITQPVKESDLALCFPHLPFRLGHWTSPSSLCKTENVLRQFTGNLLLLAKPSVLCLEVRVSKMFIDRTVYCKRRYSIWSLQSNREWTVLYVVTQLCPTVCDPTDYSPPSFSVRRDSPGKNTGVGCHALLQGIFPTQGLSLGLSHCRQILHCLDYQGSITK